MSRVLAWNAKLVKLFLTAGMSPETSDRNGITALMWAAGKGHAEIVRLLLRFGGNPNSQSPKGRTALMSAAYFGRPEIVEILLDHETLLHLKDFEDKTAADWALERNQTAIAENLKKRS